MQEHRLTVERTARVYSEGDGDGAADVWMVIHGYGQLAAEFLAPFAAISGEHRLVLAPEALNRFYKERTSGATQTRQTVGATWMTREDRDAEITDYVRYLDQVAAEFARGRRLTLVGFSQGVATAVRWAIAGRTELHRLVLWAGALPEDVELASLSPLAARGGVDFVLGSVDEYATWIDVEVQRQRLADARLDVRFHTFDGGHRVDRDVLRQLAAT